MSEKKQTVLMVHNYYQIPGGEDTVVANEKKMLEEHGHKVILYTRNNTELKTMNLFQKLLLPFTTIFNVKTYREIKKIIKREKIDIVHVHNTLNLISPSVYYAAKSMNAPVVQTIHNFRMLCPSATFYREGHICEECVLKGLKCAIQYRCYRQSRIQTLVCVINTKIHRMTGIYGEINYICLTEFNKKKLLEIKQIKKEKIFIKPNFSIDNVNILKNSLRKNQIIYLGRIEEIKGIKLLLETWKIYENQLPVLKVYGNGPLKEWCEDYIKYYSIKKVILNGFIKHENAIEEISKSIALILPTQVYEGFPMTIVEAFSCSTPVVCSDIGNAGALIETGVTGYKFDSNPYSLYKAVLNTIQDKNLNILCRNKYQNEYSEAKNYKQLINIYTMIIGENKNEN